MFLRESITANSREGKFPFRLGQYTGSWRFASDFAADLGFASMLPLLLIPAIDGQHQEADDRPTTTPFVADLLERTQSAVDPLHVIVGADLLASRAVQVGDHLVELAGC